ncbi:hypothetical protein BJV78DRAFT_837603 [Lactifluus subvellereus]|nr:hypothetical protein BJV78DRAFT_837603 [Lactifluus subvellereus]
MAFRNRDPTVSISLCSGKEGNWFTSVSMMLSSLLQDSYYTLTVTCFRTLQELCTSPQEPCQARTVFVTIAADVRQGPALSPIEWRPGNTPSSLMIYTPLAPSIFRISPFLPIPSTVHLPTVSA